MSASDDLVGSVLAEMLAGLMRAWVTGAGVGAGGEYECESFLIGVASGVGLLWRLYLRASGSLLGL